MLPSLPSSITGNIPGDRRCYSSIDAIEGALLWQVSLAGDLAHVDADVHDVKRFEPVGISVGQQEGGRVVRILSFIFPTRQSIN